MTKEKQKNQEDYYTETVANMWLTIEASVFWIGVPLLPLTPERKKMRSEFFHPLDDYIRASLASIPTPDLILIEEVLSDHGNDSRSNSLRNKIQLEPFDRAYFPLLSAGIIFTIIFCGMIPLSSSILYTSYNAGAASLGAGITGACMAVERNRIQDLKNILQNELKRRQGKFGTFNGIPALTA
jgi:hypothetical protein